MERVAGTNELLSEPDETTRGRVMSEYIEQLAHLHSLDVGSMTLSGLTVPSTPEQVAFGGQFGYLEHDWDGWEGPPSSRAASGARALVVA